MNISILHLIESGGMYGAESVIINLSCELRDQGHKNVIGCFTYKSMPKPEIGQKAILKGLETVYFELKNKIDLNLIKLIVKYCKENDIFLLHAHGYKPSIYCFIINLIYKIPYIITCHSWYSENYKHQIYLLCELVSMLQAKKIAAVSTEIGNNLRKTFIPTRLIKIIPNGIKIASHCKSISYNNKLRQELGLQQESLIVGNIGRLITPKNQTMFIRAATSTLKMVKNIEFIIVGDGPLWKNLNLLISALGIKKRFHLMGYRENITDILELIDIFVFPSLNEGLPMALLEAMYFRTAIIASNVGEIPMIIKSGFNGILINSPVSSEKLSKKIALLINNKELRMYLSNNAYDTVCKNYSSARMANAYLDVYQNIKH